MRGIGSSKVKYKGKIWWTGGAFYRCVLRVLFCILYHFVVIEIVNIVTALDIHWYTILKNSISLLKLWWRQVCYIFVEVALLYKFNHGQQTGAHFKISNAWNFTFHQLKCWSYTHTQLPWMAWNMFHIK